MQSEEVREDVNQDPRSFYPSDGGLSCSYERRTTATHPGIGFVHAFGPVSELYQSNPTPMIFPSLVCAYVRCVVLCAQCTPELQSRAANGPAAWKPWARVLLFTLLPVHRVRLVMQGDVPRSVYAPHAYRHPVRQARGALCRLGRMR